MVAEPAPVPPPAAPAPKEEAKGSFYGKMYLDWYWDATDNDAIHKRSEVEVTRVYLGYKYKLTDGITTNALLDVERANPVKSATLDATTGALSTSADTRYFAYLKLASVDWKGLLPYTTLTFGQLGYFAFNTQEGFWGKRYLFKSFMDAQGYAPSADLGATVTVVPNDMFKIIAGVTQGEGYKAPQDSYGNYRIGFGLQVKPVSDLTLYAYGDWMPVGSETSNAQTTVAAFAGYAFEDLFKLGLEYNAQMNQKGVKDANVSGLSAYGAYSIIKPLEVFARFDMAMSKDDLNTKMDGQTIIAGLQYEPAKQVKLALDYQRFMPKPDGAIDIGKIYLHCEVGY